MAPLPHLFYPIAPRRGSFTYNPSIKRVRLVDDATRDLNRRCELASLNRDVVLRQRDLSLAAQSLPTTRAGPAPLFPWYAVARDARIPTTRKVVHDVAECDDDRYAFISVEGVGSQPGTVDIIDLVALMKVASVDVGQQAGGIDFWKSEAARP